MKKMLLSLGWLMPLLLSAQVKHFLYFQTEARQPFYAKLNKNLYSSSASGYLIIPKLTDGTYTISIGFPKGQFPEQVFTCKVDNNDAGYLIKNFGDKGWGLFNLQTLDVAMAGTGAADVVVGKDVKVDEFSSMLSNAVKDPSIRRMQPTPGSDTASAIAPTVKNDPPASNQGGEPGQTLSTPAVEPALTKPLSNGVITKKLVNYALDGLEMVFIEEVDGALDTIRVFIPAEKDAASGIEAPPIKEAVAEVLEKQNNLPVPIPQDSLVTPERTHPSPPTEIPVETTKASSSGTESDKKFLPIEVRRTIDPAGTSDTMPEVQATRAPMINSDCKVLANDDDFIKLRKKMAAGADDEKMIGIASKTFKSRCFTTSQIRNLAVLFLSDAGKYRFFDLAYQFASDSHNFGELQSLLTDAYYIARFKAMVNR